MSDRAKFFWCLGSAWIVVLLFILVPAEINNKFYADLHKGIKVVFVIITIIYTITYLAVADFSPDGNTGQVNVTIPINYKYTAPKSILQQTASGGHIFLKVDNQWYEQIEPEFEEVKTDGEQQPDESGRRTVTISNGKYIDMDVIIDNKIKIKNR